MTLSCSVNRGSQLFKRRQTDSLCSLYILNLPVSNEISDLCEISDWLLLVSYFTSQNKEIMFGNFFFDVCCVN